MKNLFSGRRKFITIPLALIIWTIFIAGISASPSPKDAKQTSSTNTNSVTAPTIAVATNTPALIEKPTLIPTATPTPISTETPEPVYPTSIPTTYSSPPNTGGYNCSCSKTCSQMSSCAEAQYQLNICGCSARDADHDGTACDSQCQ